MSHHNLYIVFNPYDNLWLDLPFLFFQNAAKLVQYDIFYQYTSLDTWQRRGIDNLAILLSELGKRDISPKYKNIYRKQLDKIHHELTIENTNVNLLWNMPPLTPAGIEQLRLWLASSPLFSTFSIKPITIAQRQDYSLKQWGMLGWRKYTYKKLVEIASTLPHSLKYAPLQSALLDKFGDSCIFIDSSPYVSLSTESTIKQITKAISLPDNIFQGSSARFLPESYPGLDLHSATYDYSFTRGGRIVHDRTAFWSLLRRIEREEGFKNFSGMPAEAGTANFIEKMNADNAQIERIAGRKIFLDYPAWSPDKSHQDVFPSITTSKARPFVAAMPEDLRFGLLRYFRDFPGQLSAEQDVLAKTLESFRTQNIWAPNFKLPRSLPVLSVLTMARNHKDYIADCIESVSAQKTDFPIEHIIIDDGSDDGTQDIIDDYAVKHPHIRPIYLPEHTGKNVSTMFSVCKSEYAALCDGDDYFTDSSKLQMQIDFLRANKDCSVCFHPVHVKFENGQRDDFIFPMLEQLPRKSKKRFYLADLIQGNFIQTNSVVYRWRFREGLPEWFNPYVCPGDWYWHLLHAETGKVGFIPRVMSVYRRHSSALYSSAFIDRDKHFKEHGMHEVETINVLNQHFKGRYFLHLANLANSFFTSFYKNQIEDPDSHALDKACEKYPEFGLHFLKTLRSVQKEHPSR